MKKLEIDRFSHAGPWIFVFFPDQENKELFKKARVRIIYEKEGCLADGEVEYFLDKEYTKENALSLNLCDLGKHLEAPTKIITILGDQEISSSVIDNRRT